eukprot:GEMP01028027.1.p1 GENE.GEMP01028027.1~~GEMP01028027.1.p1  ORF type:complete len:739 (+),score=168.80 GEMP01028027.1:30-2219(+)
MNPSSAAHRSRPDDSQLQGASASAGDNPLSNKSSLTFASRGSARAGGAETVTCDDGRSDGVQDDVPARSVSSSEGRTFWKRRLGKDVDPASQRLKYLLSEFEQMEVSLEVFAKENAQLTRKLLKFYAGFSTFGKMVRALSSGSVIARLMFALWRQLCYLRKQARSSTQELALFRKTWTKKELSMVMRMWGAQGQLLLAMSFSAWRMLVTLGLENRQQLEELMCHRQGREQVLQQYHKLEAELAQERQQTKNLENSLDEANRVNESIKYEITHLNDRLFSHSEMIAEHTRAKQVLEDQINRASKTLTKQQDSLEVEHRKSGLLSEQLEEKDVELDAVQKASNDKGKQNENLHSELASATATISEQEHYIEERDEHLRRIASELAVADACIAKLRDQANNYVVTHWHDPERLSHVPPSLGGELSSFTDRTDRHATPGRPCDAPSHAHLSPPLPPSSPAPTNPTLSGHTPPAHHPSLSPQLVSHASSPSVSQLATALPNPALFALTSTVAGNTATTSYVPLPSHGNLMTTRSLSPDVHHSIKSPTSGTPHVPKFPVSQQFPFSTSWAHTRPSSHGHHVDFAGRGIIPLSVPPPHDDATSIFARTFALPPRATAPQQQLSQLSSSPPLQHGMARSSSAKIIRYNLTSSPASQGMHHDRLGEARHALAYRMPPPSLSLAIDATTAEPLVPAAHVPAAILTRKSLPSRHSLASSISTASLAVPASRKERAYIARV